MKTLFKVENLKRGIVQHRSFQETCSAGRALELVKMRTFVKGGKWSVEVAQLKTEEN